LKAVNETSGKAFALWITFLTVATYLAIASAPRPTCNCRLAGSARRFCRDHHYVALIF
jgi:hypothetical protein